MNNEFDEFDQRKVYVRELVDAYRYHGFVVIRNMVLPSIIDAYRMQLTKLIGERLKSLGLRQWEEMDLDQRYHYLCACNRKAGGGIVDVGKELTWFYSIMLEPNLLEWVKSCMGSRTLHIPYGLSLFRADQPREDRHTFAWHQDYPYNMMSQSAITVWIPLTDVTSDMGRLCVVPGSHTRIRAVDARTDYAPGSAMSNRLFTLRDETGLEDAAVEISASAGDAVIFHSLLLHRSGRNNSDGRTRWVVNYRYGDATDPRILNDGWRVVRGTKQLFHERHPDLAYLRCSACGGAMVRSVLTMAGRDVGGSVVRGMEYICNSCAGNKIIPGQ